MNFYATKVVCCPPMPIGRQTPADGTFGKRWSGTAKMLRIMKLTAFILLIGCLHATAHGVAQDRITFSGDGVTLKKVFTVIKKQTSYLFLYNDELLQNAKKVSINVRNASVEEVLALILRDQPLDYTIKGKTIFIIIKQEPEKKDPPSSMNGAPPFDEIKGRITNAQGEPLGGANIVIKRTGKGTQANANGEFTLKNVGQDEVLTITYTGYAPQTVKVSGSILLLVMKVAESELDETIVQAYGTTTRRLATGNIARVTAAEIERQPVMNPLLALQGRVAGLVVTQTSGYASAPIKVELRGRTAVGDFPSDPLYIIDGVPLTILDVSGDALYGRGASFLQTGGYNGPANGQSPLFNINPLDIESIEVLKDADATAIYGSRGANGVILITTKKGKAGKTKFDISVQQGITKATKFWDMLNTRQYLDMRREAFKNDNITPTPGNAYDLLVWDSTRYTDWQKALYGGSGKNTNVQLGLSGGDIRTSFRISAGYNHTTNILTVSGADKRASVSMNLTHRSLDQRFSISATNSFTYTQSDMIQLPGSITYAPNAPAIFDANGNLNFAGWAPISDQFPFAGLKQPYTSKTNFLNSNLVISYQVIKGMNFSTSVGYNNGQANQSYFRPIASQDPALNPTGSASWGNNSNKNWIIEPQISYSIMIGKGKLNALAGGTLQETRTNGLGVNGTGYTNDALLGTISNAPNIEGTENYGKYRYNAVFGRITYNWRNKYIVSLNGRRDGSSKFGAGKQFGNFGSVGAAWIFTEERVLKNLTWFSYGKLRLSYGTTGSDAVKDYAYLTRWSSNGTQVYDGIQPLQPLQHANPDYHWQVNKKLEGGLDIGLFNDRITLALAVYRNRCGSQLIEFPVPAFSGFTYVIANSPALVENKGLEISAAAQVIKGKNFSWSVNFNTAFNRNKLVAYPNFEKSPFVNYYVIGEPLNISKYLHFTGVDPQTGEYTFEDKNKDGNISTSNGTLDDRYVYKRDPKFTGGVGMNFRYRNRLQLYLFFNVVKQLGINAINQGNFPGLVANQPVEVLSDRWQNAGDKVSSARFTTQPKDSDFKYKVESDGGFTDASFIRLSTVSFSYSLAERLISKAGMKGCSLFLNTNNLFVITSYKGIDPETQNFGSLPPAKTIVAGLNFNF